MTTSQNFLSLRTFRRDFLKSSALMTAGLCLNSQGMADSDESQKKKAIRPKDHVIQLFNGKDLSGLYGWLKDSKFDDPRKVFSVTDGLLCISGEVAGYLGTQKEYWDYRLVVEYKWGSRTDGSGTVRNSGILLHAIGEDGNPSPWMSSIECQVAQGCVGDFIVIRGKN